MGQSARRWKFGWCEYVEISRTLFVRGQRSELRGKSLDVLQLLLVQPDSVVPNVTLIKEIWGNASRQSLTVAISKLRKAFGGELDDIIQNVASEGYRMAVQVECIVTDEPASPTLHLEAGQQIFGHAAWKTIARLGGPGHGPVWLAENNDTGEQRVYKFATDGVRLRGLQREETVARILGRSAEAVECHRRLDEWNFSTSPYYIAGEYVGPDLQAFVESEDFSEFSRPERVRLIAKLADTVAAAHALGVLHNDLKPSNILVRKLPEPRLDASASDRYAIVLIDFGDSSLLDDGVSRPRAEGQVEEDIFNSQGPSSGTTGSELYRAPEIRSGTAGTVEADIFALGIILYQCIVGDLKFPPSAGWQQEVLDPLLEEDIARAANSDPHKRFRSAAALAEQLYSLERRRDDAAERDRNELRMQQVRRDLDRARAVRPWIAAALVSLTLGVLISVLFYRSAVHERNVAQRQNRSLEAMLTFINEDVISQSNPASGMPGSSRAIDLTLSRAILAAIPQIDRRFSQEPLVAGKLHETIADGLRARTQFLEADREYAVSAERYRAAEGALSQAAIAAELKRDATKMVGLLPGQVQKARENFNQQVRLIEQVHHPAPMVVVLRDFVESGLIGLESDPSKAVPPLERAIRLAEATPGFDPLLLLWIKGRYCGLYVRMQDGPNLEAAARERIRAISARYGADSPMLVSYEMYLQEAYYLQNKFKDAVEQADRNYPRFKHLVGDQSQYTLAVLANRAASLAQLGRYSEAANDDMRLYELEADDPSGYRMKVGSLHDAALFTCRAGKYQKGLEEARRVASEAGPGPNSMPAFFNGAKFIQAECMLGEQESSRKVNSRTVENAELLLKQVDTDLIARQAGEPAYAAFVTLGKARVAMLRQDFSAAADHVSKVQVFFAKPGNDPYELQQYRRVKARLTATVLPQIRP